LEGRFLSFFTDAFNLNVALLSVDIQSLKTFSAISTFPVRETDSIA